MSIRASDAEREQVAERLRHAAVEGRLFPDELEERLAAALTARTHGELAALLSDLPAPVPTAPVATRSSWPWWPLVFGACLLLLLASAVPGFGPHHHHDGGFDGLPLVWLVWLAIGWRLVARFRRGTR